MTRLGPGPRRVGAPGGGAAAPRRARKTGMRCGAGFGPADGGDGVQRAVEARLQIGERTGLERTRNMPCMFVTPEVSQLETSALKFSKL